MVCDANGQSLAYVYCCENDSDARMAKVLTEDEARREFIQANALQVANPSLRPSP
jgi:hypothetical protein